MGIKVEDINEYFRKERERVQKMLEKEYAEIADFDRKTGQILIFLIILALLLLAITVYPVFAYVEPVDYHGIPLKFYHEDSDREKAIEALDEIPFRYYEGIKYIKFFKITGEPCAMYNLYSGLEFRRGCFDRVRLIHELAHHCQILRGDSYYNVLKHSGKFDECEREIWET